MQVSQQSFADQVAQDARYAQSLEDRPVYLVKVKRAYADPAMNGYYCWYYEGVTASRALELAAWNCAAQCVDYVALECVPA